MALRSGVLLLAAVMMLSCTDRDSLPLILLVGEPTVSRLPYIIAFDQGLYEKHGLNVELRFREPGPGGQIVHYTDFVTKILRGLDWDELQRYREALNDLFDEMSRAAASCC